MLFVGVVKVPSLVVYVVVVQDEIAHVDGDGVREFTQRVKRARVPRRRFLKLPVIRRVFDRARDFLSSSVVIIIII